MKQNRIFIAMVLSFTLIFSTVSVFADNTNVYLNNINIIVNDVKIAASGESYTLDDNTPVPYSLLYSKTTYLPMRKIGEIVGKEITFDKPSKTAGINSTTATVKPLKPSTFSAKSGTTVNINLSFNNLNIKVDDKIVAKVGDSFKLKDGTVVPFSIIYKGTTYLPMRKIADLVGLDVGYDSKTTTAELGDKAGGYEKFPTVPDFGLIAKTPVVKTIEVPNDYTNYYISDNLSLAEHEIFVTNLEKNSFDYKGKVDMPEISQGANCYVYENSKENLKVLYGAIKNDNIQYVFISIRPIITVTPSQNPPVTPANEATPSAITSSSVTTE